MIFFVLEFWTLFVNTQFENGLAYQNYPLGYTKYQQSCDCLERGGGIFEDESTLFLPFLSLVCNDIAMMIELKESQLVCWSGI